jgi:magnesium chelatase family protein
MAFARVYSAQIDILSGKIVSVEVDTSRGLNSFTIVGLADRAVDEARDRVGSALKNSNFESPKSKKSKDCGITRTGRPEKRRFSF